MRRESSQTSPDHNLFNAAGNIYGLLHEYNHDALFKPDRLDANGNYDPNASGLTEEFIRYATTHLDPTSMGNGNNNILTIGTTQHHFPGWIKTTIDHKRNKNRTLPYSECYLIVGQNRVMKYTITGPTANFFGEDAQQPFFPYESGFIGIKQFKEMDPLRIQIGTFTKSVSEAIKYTVGSFQAGLEQIDGKTTLLTPAEIRTIIDLSVEDIPQRLSGESANNPKTQLLQKLERAEQAVAIAQSQYRGKIANSVATLSQELHRQTQTKYPIEVATHYTLSGDPVLFLPDFGEVVTKPSMSDSSSKVPNTLYFDVISQGIDFLLANGPPEYRQQAA